MPNSKKEKVKKIIAVLKFALLIILIIGIPLYLGIFQREAIAQFTSVEEFEHALESYKGWGYSIIIFCQVLQIVISILPSQWIQISGAYVYGFLITAVLSIIGTIVGSILAYYIAKALGKDAITLFMSEEKINNFLEKLNSKKAMIFVAVIYFIPGLPKDLCNYAAGISNMNFKMFLVVSMVARTPAMMMSILVGNQFGEGNYGAVIIISVIMIILFGLGAIFRKKVFAFVDIAYDKLSGN